MGARPRETEEQNGPVQRGGHRHGRAAGGGRGRFNRAGYKKARGEAAFEGGSAAWVTRSHTINSRSQVVR